MPVINPTLELERELFAQGFTHVAGVDEVGRGALAGPVSVGIAVINNSVSDIPQGLRDSKLMTKPNREKIISVLHEWVTDRAVGHASAAEIDQFGIMGGLRLAYSRAAEQLTVAVDHIILDGKHNWLYSGAEDLFSPTIDQSIPVTMKIKADAHCAVVSAGSVLAKVERDGLMAEAAIDYPDYGWAGNVGYGAQQHMDALRTLGVTPFHRTSWSLPGQGEQ